MERSKVNSSNVVLWQKCLSLFTLSVCLSVCIHKTIRTFSGEERVHSPVADHQAVLLDEVGRRINIWEHQHPGQVLHGERCRPLGAHRVGDVQGQQSLGSHLDTQTETARQVERNTDRQTSTQ